MAELTEEERSEIRQRIAAYRAPEVTASHGQDVDPYRCPTCDRSLIRIGPSDQGMQMDCPEHGRVKPLYDGFRASRGARLSFAPSKCGCSEDSGLYTMHCDDHSPEELLEFLIAKVEKILAEDQ